MQTLSLPNYCLLKEEAGIGTEAPALGGLTLKFTHPHLALNPDK